MGVRWRGKFVIGAAVVCALAACTREATAQEVPRSYVFLEVLDDLDRPVSAAVAVTYNESGEEVGSGVTDSAGVVQVLETTWHRESILIFRVLKPGYLTSEAVSKSSTGHRWSNERLKIKLVRVSTPGVVGARPAPRPPRGAAPSKAARGHPT